MATQLAVRKWRRHGWGKCYLQVMSLQKFGWKRIYVRTDFSVNHFLMILDLHYQSPIQMVGYSSCFLPAWPSFVCCLQLLFARRFLIDPQLSWKNNKIIQNIYHITSKRNTNMWFNLGKSVWSQTCDISSFLFGWNIMLIWRENILMETHQTSGSKVMSNWRILKTIENKRHSFWHFSGYIWQSIMRPTSDWLC